MMIKHFPIKCRVVKPKQKQKQRPIKRKEIFLHYAVEAQSCGLWKVHILTYEAI